MLIPSRVAACDSLRSLLSFRGVDRTYRALVGGTYCHSFYRSLLAKWKVSAEPNARARKYKTTFSLVFRELHAGRCATCRKRVDRAGAPVGGVCREYRTNHALKLYRLNRPAFELFPRRAIVRLDAPPYYPKSKGKPAKRRRTALKPSKKLVTACLGLRHWLANLLGPRTRISGYARMRRRYELEVVEKCMAAWTGRTEPPINAAVDWRALDQAGDGDGGAGSDGTEDDEDDEEDDDDEDDESDDDDALLIRPVEE
ncbi:hypothetical protein AMAG_03512 [Allomyces macrogynus ATCC 38327]|uniref:Uncharacterized protein n=1 Tax=Allomyces macrogynus (strain ATCC 38327) TaxID=578462 RepID=A0A0L0S9R1_ALLM3|nr:hypothetical protein AMAG_03512 [Allomyces macrogynus ATCC 38327]|eukprot:KNE59187.1 hypothetical protein AMAG_03512 [Allomyces macrogynus ATCC 38327]